jgi:mRNA interferase RelE/StbE
VYTFRIGLSYRAILSIHDSVLIVHVLEIEHRRQAYRDF